MEKHNDIRTKEIRTNIRSSINTHTTALCGEVFVNRHRPVSQKIQRQGDNSRADLAYTEFQELLEAKQELESVLNAGLAGDDLSWSND